MPTTPATSTPLLLIHGDDEFGVRQRAQQVDTEWAAELGGLDHDVIDAQAGHGGEALKSLDRLRESLQTLPFFGNAKAIWLKNCNFLGTDRTASSQAVNESLAELAQELKAFTWSNVRLLISAGEVDKRKALYKTVEKLGRVESFSAWSIEDKSWPGEAEKSARRALGALKKEIGDEALAELVNSVGPNNRQLASEVEKLGLYSGKRTNIELADVRAIVTRNKHARAFALADALGDRDLPRLLRTLDQELWELQFDKQKSEIGLLYGLITKVRVMIFLQEMLREGLIKQEEDYYRFKAQLERVPAGRLPEDKRFNPLAMNPYLLFKALPHAGRYSLEELVRAMSLLLECNRRLISSSLDDALVLQQALVQIVRGECRSRPAGKSELASHF
jgi:DNA polymerase-3 subunit delta